MPKKYRANRKANRRRRVLAALRQEPLPMAEQQRRAAENLAAYRKRYPTPPTYNPLVSVGGYVRPVPRPKLSSTPLLLPVWAALVARYGFKFGRARR